MEVDPVNHDKMLRYYILDGPCKNIYHSLTVTISTSLTVAPY